MTIQRICFFASVAFIAWFGACQKSSAEIREWRPEDHDKSAPPAQDVRSDPTALVEPGTEKPDTSLVDLAWRKNCVTCHGQLGRGDGPQGAMVRAPDLTRKEWQARVTDAEMLDVIKKGRNRMPAFNLPDTVLTGLVAHIRTLRAK